jgi:hypothetical protein
MTVRPPPGFPLPELVTVANRVITEEADSLRVEMENFSNAPRSGCPWNQDDAAVSNHASPYAEGRAKLLLYARHQAILIYVNAYDHLITLARDLGGDGAMPLFSHASLSRVICEAAVRFAWLMDSDISSEERIMRGAAALYYSSDERSKAVRRLPPERFDPRIYQHMLDSCTAERNDIQKLVADAGLTFGHSRDGKTETRLELESPGTSVPLKISVSELMAELLPDSPSWYNVGSSVTHSLYWGLRDVNHSRPGQPLALTPSVLDVGAAAECAISASGLILDRGARIYGYDPSAYLRSTRVRREEVDALMRRAVTSAWAHIPTEPELRGPNGPWK